MTNILSTKAMLATVRIAQWSARKLDKRITDEVNSQHGAAADAGRYNKALIAGEALKTIQACANAARTTHYGLTLPWLDDGARILPAALHGDYSKKMQALREAFEQAADKFVQGYPGFVADAKVRLNGMFNAADYPEPADIVKRFSFSTSLFPVPDQADFRVTIGEGEAARIRAEIEKASADALAGAMRNVWERIAETIGHMAAKLEAFKPARGSDKAEGIFRDSMVENVRELAGLLPALNLTGDARLTAITARIETALCPHDADTLRESPDARRRAADAAKAICDEVSAFMA